MNLIGLLSWFDEPKRTLAWCIQALAQAGVDHLVAVDGRYRLFPGDEHLSSPDQYAVIHAACREYGLGLTTYQPQWAWEGNEVEKRTRMFAAALTSAEPGDWFWVMDADQIVTQVPEGFKQQLEQTDHDVARVRFHDVLARKANRPDMPWQHDVRNLFRAQPIHVEINHYTYVASVTGDVLWEGNHGPREVPALDLTQTVVVEHHPGQRETERQRRKAEYYTTRDSQAVERGDCEKCGEPAATRMPVDWRKDTTTGVGLYSILGELCAPCAEQQADKNDKRIQYLGYDPGSIRWREMYTPPDGLPA